MPHVTLLGSLVLYEPQLARERILEALRAEHGNLTHTAKRLDVSHRSLLRWVAELGLQRDVDLIRTQAGWENPKVAPKRPKTARNDDLPSGHYERPKARKGR